MSIKNLMVDEFKSELEELSKMEVGTDKYRTTVDGVTKLADRIIEIEKHEEDCELKDIERTNDEQFKAQQLKAEKRDRLVKNCLTGVNVIGGMGLAALAFVASMNFEKEGTLTTEGGKTALRQLLKFK